ncbi:hypothetical protein BIT28_22430 [Photobacterium proteolyticum]|uniref:Alcohol dehydrogenase iron-type/glycerol dehydrogenase GldA domain-containing protein n=1 Tax=Photobacterium proteolyticum TaxID=1903952 RepID=A0A1Q9GLI0_9GAMM|nr:iron-containing alcohol dehydrogenase [Photobacterium proteolyticum]OLQ75403.1 hypothetical protein BIT28_22430 [Photobacterium proteolyticum]
MGKGAIKDLGPELKARNFQKALIVTDKGLVGIKLIDSLPKELDAYNVEFTIFDEIKPNPTEQNIEDGLSILKDQECDVVISFGGGSSHDCAKGIH